MAKGLPPTPVLQELTVLEADPPGPPIGFVVHEYIGSRVYKLRRDGTVQTEPLTRLEDVQEGDELAIPWLTGGYALMRVKRGEDGKLRAYGSNHLTVLCFDVDDRHCWTIGGIVNLRGLERLEIKK